MLIIKNWKYLQRKTCTNIYKENEKGEDDVFNLKFKYIILFLYI